MVYQNSKYMLKNGGYIIVTTVGGKITKKIYEDRKGELFFLNNSSYNSIVFHLEIYEKFVNGKEVLPDYFPQVINENDVIIEKYKIIKGKK